jgi:hypothetical protein
MKKAKTDHAAARPSSARNALAALRGMVGPMSIAGAAVLGAAAVATAAVLERRAIASMASQGVAMTAKLAQSLAAVAGLQHKPFYLRALPGAGLIAGVIAGGVVVYLLVSKIQTHAADEREPNTERPAGESNAWNVEPGGHLNATG